MNLLMAQSGRPNTLSQRPLSGVKRTFARLAVMSAYDPKRTLGRTVDARPRTSEVPDILGTPWISSRSVMNCRLGIGREGGVARRSAQQVQRHFDRFIVRLIGGHIGLRASLLGTLGFEVAAQRCFALGVDLSLHVIRNVLQDFDVRRDARGLNRVPRRRVIPRRSQPQRAIAAAERNDRLHRSFAERSRADEGGALLVLQGAGDDFRGRCRAAVDQDDQRLALDHDSVPRIEALRLFGIAAAGRYDLALL